MGIGVCVAVLLILAASAHGLLQDAVHTPGLIFVNAGGAGGAQLVDWLAFVGGQKDLVALCELQGWTALSLHATATSAGP